MDAVEFLKQYQRMCKSYTSCESCELYSDFLSSGCLDSDPKTSVRVVEQWAQTHPQKAMIQDFFEKFPNAPKGKTGAPGVCPYDCGYGDFDCEQANGICYNCWSRPLEG